MRILTHILICSSNIINNKDNNIEYFVLYDYNLVNTNRTQNIIRGMHEIY